MAETTFSIVARCAVTRFLLLEFFSTSPRHLMRNLFSATSRSSE